MTILSVHISTQSKLMTSFKNMYMSQKREDKWDIMSKEKTKIQLKCNFYHQNCYPHQLQFLESWTVSINTNSLNTFSWVYYVPKILSITVRFFFSYYDTLMAILSLSLYNKKKTAILYISESMKKYNCDIQMLQFSWEMLTTLLKFSCRW